MIYLDILANKEENYMLYLNGKQYNDINEYWCECLLFLKDILASQVKIQLRETDKKYQDFPEMIENYKDNEPIWRRIKLDEINDYLSTRTIKWESNGGEIIIIKPFDRVPDSISFESLMLGKWYVLIR